MKKEITIKERLRDISIYEIFDNKTFEKAIQTLNDIKEAYNNKGDLYLEYDSYEGELIVFYYKTRLETDSEYKARLKKEEKYSRMDMLEKELEFKEYLRLKKKYE